MLVISDAWHTASHAFLHSSSALRGSIVFDVCVFVGSVGSKFSDQLHRLAVIYGAFRFQGPHTMCDRLDNIPSCKIKQPGNDDHVVHVVPQVDAYH